MQVRLRCSTLAKTKRIKKEIAEMKRIEFEGKQVNVGFNLAVMLEAEETFGQSVEELIKEGSIPAVVRVAYCCIKVHNDDVPPFREWAKLVCNVEYFAVLMRAVNEEMAKFYTINKKYSSDEKEKEGEDTKNA